MDSANRSQIFVVFLVAALVVLLAWAGNVRVELAGHSRADNVTAQEPEGGTGQSDRVMLEVPNVVGYTHRDIYEWGRTNSDLFWFAFTTEVGYQHSVACHSSKEGVALSQMPRGGQKISARPGQRVSVSVRLDC